MPSAHPAWLRNLVNEQDVDPKALLAATALEIALSPRTGKTRRPRTPRGPVDRSRLPPYDKDLQCKHCGKVFRRVCNYREHQRVHSNEYKFQCSVQGCDRKFMWRSSIQAHLRSHQAKVDRRRAHRRTTPPPQLPALQPVHHGSKGTPFSPVSPMQPHVSYYSQQSAHPSGYYGPRMR